MALPPAGWYPDAQGTTRWWDGAAWTEHTQAAPPTAVRPPLFWAAAAAAGGLVIGGFAPWATALGLVSVSGTHGDGWVAILGGLVALGMLFVASGRAARMNYAVPLVVAGVCGLVGVIDAADISSRSRLIDPGWGLWLVLLASAVLAATSLALLTRRPAQPATESQPSGAVPAGWYPDPHGQGRLRYWNGRMWTPQILE